VNTRSCRGNLFLGDWAKLESKSPGGGWLAFSTKEPAEVCSAGDLGKDVGAVECTNCPKGKVGGNRSEKIVLAFQGDETSGGGACC